MQSRLTVEYNDVIIYQVTLHLRKDVHHMCYLIQEIAPDLVATQQVKVTWLWVVAEVHPLTIVSDNVLGSRVLLSPLLHQFMHPG